MDFLSFGTPVSVSGADLLDHGVELHDLIPSTYKTGFLVDISQIQLTFTYNHPVGIAFGSGAWLPWTVTINSGAPNYDLIFACQGPIGVQGGSAPINENFNPMNGNKHSFGLLDATPVDDQDGIIARDFRNVTVTLTAINTQGADERGSPNVPEPGSLALGAVLLGTVLLPALRGHRHRV